MTILTQLRVQEECISLGFMLDLRLTIQIGVLMFPRAQLAK